jgi:NAD(P)-dependent dehydrogenase (short-subunit alcohol dehydrogenase family)
MTMEYDSKHVVITGGTGGLGGAVVDNLLRRGATVHLPCFEDAVPERCAWAGHERAVPTVNVSLTDESAVADYYSSLPALWASIHLVGGFAMKPFVDTSLDELQRMLMLNVTTCFLSTREAVRAIAATGAGGRIVNIASRPALEPTGGMIAYSTAKAAVAAMTAGVAAEVHGDSILVNAVAPSIIDTPANREAMPTADHSTWPTPAQIAETIGFLASSGNHLTWGTTVPVYGRA